MCTVSYIPLQEGYLLTSNRDENPLRPTLLPQKQRLSNGETIVAPVDKQKFGTWIATNTRNKTACLLNGAYKKHKRNLPYKRSRGHYVVEAFMHGTFSGFVEKVDLTGIEPFTLLFIEDRTLQVMVWDGKEKHYKVLDNKVPQIWSSSTLYTEEEHREKEAFFRNVLTEKKTDETQVLQMHGLQEKTPFILDKPHVKTVSIAQIISKNNKITLNYYPKN